MNWEFSGEHAKILLDAIIPDFIRKRFFKDPVSTIIKQQQLMEQHQLAGRSNNVISGANQTHNRNVVVPVVTEKSTTASTTEKPLSKKSPSKLSPSKTASKEAVSPILSSSTRNVIFGRKNP